MTWERGRRLAGITKGNNTIAYTYDDSGLHLSKTVNGQKTTYYVLNGELLGQQTQDSSTLQFLFDESGAKYGFIYNGATYYYNLNLQGDVTGIFDSTGANVVQYAYDEWGKLLSVTGTLADTVGQINPIRYRSYYYDSETGFYYLQSRYYDPETGRFINADGILGANGDILSYNLFTYCSNNPINHCDPTGKAIGQLWQIIKAAALVALGIITIQAIINTTTPQGRQDNANMSRSLSQAVSSAKDTLVRASTAFVKDYKVSKSNSRTKEKTVAKPAVPKKATVIYRYGGTNPGNLTPSKRDVDLYPTTGKGLSFSTIPKPGAAMTTIEALNATGVVYAIQDGAGHVSVHPIGGTLEDWYNAGSSSVWTRAVKSVVVKWDGVN